MKTGMRPGPPCEARWKCRAHRAADDSLFSETQEPRRNGSRPADARTIPRKEDPPAAQGPHSLPFLRLIPRLESKPGLRLMPGLTNAG